ncbi:MAG: response regulator transcription factor [Proteobacteria bacterium]|nr:response regulator transcription factor [Pseudomonadota bacterium]
MCAGEAVVEAAAIRDLWPESHIVFLFESASIDDSMQVMMSEIDGCVPLSASPDTLVSTLKLVLSTDVRVIVVTDSGHRSSVHPQTGRLNTAATDEGSSSVTDRISVPTASLEVHASPDRYGSEQRRNATGPTLSEREAQILDGLVKGHANKVIARTCDITEATVKVHMKSILRKIRVANRTQAAIWALENGYSFDKARAGMPEQQNSPAML